MIARAGAGVVSEEEDLSFLIHIGALVAVYQAEIIGLTHALDRLGD